jgi:hypothetical protein
MKTWKITMIIHSPPSKPNSNPGFRISSIEGTESEALSWLEKQPELFKKTNAWLRKNRYMK